MIMKFLYWLPLFFMQQMCLTVVFVRKTFSGTRNTLDCFLLTNVSVCSVASTLFILFPGTTRLIKVKDKVILFQVLSSLVSGFHLDVILMLS